MRMAFGLAGILVTIGVIVLILNFAILPHTQQVIKSGNTAREEAGQLAGIDTTTNMRASESIKLEGQSSGGRLQSLLVTNLVDGGPMQKFFGLQRNDTIVEVGPQHVRDINDEELAKDLTYEAYQRQQTLVVIRDGQRVTLAPGAGLPKQQPAAASAQPGQKPAANSSSDPLQKQLDVLQRIPSH